jgi:DNA-binding NarL/FixJ family response regulator
MTVLIVDDHAAYRSFLRMTLERGGFDVVGDVPDGATAIAQARAMRPDLVLLDIQLGDGPDGFAVAETLAALDSPPRIVLLSSRDREAYAERIDKAPVLGFLPKEEVSAEVVRDLLPRGVPRAVIADDSVLFREGLARVLSDLGVEVIAQVGDATELEAVLMTTPVDIAIVDIRMPPTFTTEGLAAAEALATTHPTVGVLVLSNHLEADYAVRLLDQQPARRGYLLKERVGDLASFGDAVHRIAAGGVALDPEMVRELAVQPAAGLKDLSEREMDVLRLMAEGFSNERIGTLLFLSHRTVEAHIGRIFTKFGIDRSAGQNSRVAAVLAFLNSGVDQH